GGATGPTDPTGLSDRPQPTVAARSSPRPQPRTAEAAGDSIRRPPTFGAPAARPADVRRPGGRTRDALVVAAQRARARDRARAHRHGARVRRRRAPAARCE